MRKNKIFLVGQICGWLLIAASVVADITDYERPIATVPTPDPPFTALPYSSVSFRWVYHNDPVISNEIDAQVGRIQIYLSETVGFKQWGGSYVGVCAGYYIGPRTGFTSLECGEELKPDQWYKWTIVPKFKEGTPLANRRTQGVTSFFKTMPTSSESGAYKAKVYLEVDRMSSVSWDFLSGVRHHKPTHHESETTDHTPENIYARAGIDLIVEKDEDTLIDPKPSGNYTDAELHAIAFGDGKGNPGYMNGLPPQGSWHVHCAILSKFSEFTETETISGTISRQNAENALGITIFYPDSAKKEITHSSFIVFSKNIENAAIKPEDHFITNSQKLLLPTVLARIQKMGISWVKDAMHLHVTVHELGHVLQLVHGDAVEWTGENCSFISCSNERSIMSGGFGPLIGPEWQYDFSDKSLQHFYDHDRSKWRPYQRPFSKSYNCH